MSCRDMRLCGVIDTQITHVHTFALCGMSQPSVNNIMEMQDGFLKSVFDLDKKVEKMSLLAGQQWQNQLFVLLQTVYSQR